MRFRNSIIAFFLLTSSCCFSQTSFKNIDTLLFKVFETVNLNDSSKYIGLLNQQTLFMDKKIYTKKDSLTVLTPFYDFYSDFRVSIADLASSDEFTLSYLEFVNPLKKTINPDHNGKVLLHVKLIVNETFAVTVPFKLTVRDGLYYTEDPLIAMFLEN